MPETTLTVALGEQRYRVQRPWGDLPKGMVTDVTVDSRGHVFVLLRWDPIEDSTSARVVELDANGRRLAAWGGAAIADAHMFAAGPGDRLHVVDRDAHEIVVFDVSGNRISGIGERHGPGRPFNHPADVAFASNGDIYVADGYAGHSVHRISANGRVSRASPVHTVMRNCTRDEGGPLGAGDQELAPSRCKLLSSKAMVVSVAETSRQDLGRYDAGRRAQANRL